MGRSEKIVYYHELVALLASDNKFISLLEVSWHSPEARKAVTDCLLACLKSLKAPATMTGSSDVFSDFAAFCANPQFHDNLPKNLCDALRLRSQLHRHKINEAAQLRRIFCFKAGLNWKSPLQAIRRENRLNGIPRWVAIDLGEPYPPRGHWVTENDAVYNLWKVYLGTRKMHDKRTPSHPIHQLDPEALIHDIPPDQDAIFEEGIGDESKPICCGMHHAFLISVIRGISWHRHAQLLPRSQTHRIRQQSLAA